MRFLLGLLFFVILPCPAFGEVQRVQANDSNQQAQTTKQRGTASGTPVKLVSPPKPQPQLTQEAKNRIEKANLDRRLVEATSDLASFTAGLFMATVVLAIGTAVLGALGFLQWRDTQKMLGIAQRSSEATETAASAARDSSYIANRTVNSAEQNAHRDLRAYVGVTPDGPTMKEGTPACVTITVRNFGRTPARKVITFGANKILPYPVPGSNWTEVVPTGDPEAYLSCYPGVEGTIKDVVYGANSLTKEEIADINNGAARRLYAYGRVNYEDVFGVSHYTEFNFIFGGDLNVRSFVFLYASENNNAT